jgi:protein-S-isoprenylcysteine O-methyltransferase Ste14
MKSTFIFPCLFLLIIGLLRFFETDWLYKNRLKGKKYAKWTLFGFNASYGLTIFITIIEYILVKRKINIGVTIISVIMMIIRLLLKLWASKTLGDYWSPHIEIKENHKLIKDGPYKYIRHPAYLGTIIDIIAVALFLNSYYTLLLILLIRFSMVLIRIKIEEKILTDYFGEEYINYKKTTWALVPKIF